MKKPLRHIILLVMMLLTIASCAPGVPDEYIQPDEMEDILYDYHIAMAMAEQGDYAQHDVREAAYRQAVLKKHGYTEAQMTASMQYYTRHTTYLHDIYDNLTDRLNDEAKELGANGTSIDVKGNSLNGDTTNVWRANTSIILMPQQGFNSYSFNLKVDTAYHKGDHLMLELNSTYIIQQGIRNAIGVLVVTLANDSIVSQVMRLSSDSHQSISVNDYGNIGIKGVKGYFIFPPENSILPSSTLKILCLDRIRLIRMHPKKDSQQPNGQPNGQQADSQQNKRMAVPIPSGPVPIQQGSKTGTVTNQQVPNIRPTGPQTNPQGHDVKKGTLTPVSKLKPRALR